MKNKTITLQLGPETVRFLAELHAGITKDYKGVLTMTNIAQHLILTGMHQAKAEFHLKNNVPSSVLE